MAAPDLAPMHLAINDAYFAIKPDLTKPSTYLTKNNSDPAYRLPELSDATDERLVELSLI